MKRLIAGLLLAVSAHAEIDVPRMVRAIIEVEQGKWGELGGAGNMTYDAWAEECPFAYTLSMNREYALPVYEKRVRRIITGFQRARLTATPARIYLAWWKGLSGALQRIRAGRIPEQAGNCQNLYESLGP